MIVWFIFSPSEYLVCLCLNLHPLIWNLLVDLAYSNYCGILTVIFSCLHFFYICQLVFAIRKSCHLFIFFIFIYICIIWISEYFIIWGIIQYYNLFTLLLKMFDYWPGESFRWNLWTFDILLFFSFFGIFLLPGTTRCFGFSLYFACLGFGLNQFSKAVSH